jgi:putative transposase
MRQFIPFLDYDVEIRKVICSTNAIGSLNAIPPRDLGTRPFPHRTGSHEVPVPCDRSLDPTGAGAPDDYALEARGQGIRHHLR